MLPSGKEIAIGPVAMAGAQVTRRIYAPGNTGYLRFIDTVSNTSNTEQTYSLAISGYYSICYYYCQASLYVNPNANNQRYAVHWAGSTAYYANAAAGYVLSGAGVGSTAPDSVSILDGTRYFNWAWTTITVRPGESASFLTFSSIRSPSLLDEVQTQSANLSNMTVPGMFDGLSLNDKTNIKNFVIP